MKLEEMIHGFWRDTASLHAAMPLERFFTGPAEIPTIPCVLLVNEKTDLLAHTNREHPLTTVSVRFEVRHGDFELGSELARLIEQTFDRLRLDEPSGSRSFLFRFVKAENRRDGDSDWVFVRYFRSVG